MPIASLIYVVFYISNINDIVFVNRLEYVFSVYDHQIPEGVDFADYGEFDFNSDVIVWWKIMQERRLINNEIPLIDVLAITEASNLDVARVGKAGPLARFQIVDNYLYTVSSHEMTIFNINNLSQPTLVNNQYTGNNIETMFQADGYLYMGEYLWYVYL